MNAVFADSFYFLARLNPRDQAHQEAVRLGTEDSRPLVTTDWVLTEVGDAMSAPTNRPAFLRLLDLLRSSREVEIVPATRELLDRGVVLFSERPDKEWSLTDCISFVVMRERQLSEAFTGDQHFEQAGFRALLVETHR